MSPETDGDARAPFDVVSMSHYLEHTIDPRAEVEAAATVLPAGGLLLIEVPDPESRLQNLLGRWWVPWFQPQHLNLLPMKTLMELLRESGFSVVEAHRGPAHQAVDFFMAGWLILDNLAPEPDRPWMPPAASGARFKRFVVRAVLGPPLLLAGTLTDRILAAVLTRKPGWSNTYRVLARRNAPPPDPSAEPEAAEAPAATDEPAADGDSEE